MIGAIIPEGHPKTRKKLFPGFPEDPDAIHPNKVRAPIRTKMAETKSDAVEGSAIEASWSLIWFPRNSLLRTGLRCSLRLKKEKTRYGYPSGEFMFSGFKAGGLLLGEFLSFRPDRRNQREKEKQQGDEERSQRQRPGDKDVQAALGDD